MDGLQNGAKHSTSLTRKWKRIVDKTTSFPIISTKGTDMIVRLVKGRLLMVSEQNKEYVRCVNETGDRNAFSSSMSGHYFHSNTSPPSNANFQGTYVVSICSW